VRAQPVRRLAATGLALLALGGCSLEEDGEPPPTSAPAPQTPTAEPPAAPRPLEDAWYQDSDRNSIPDFVEERVGRDPNKDDCVPTECRLPKGTSLEQLETGENTLIIFDSSGSMAAPAGGGQTKIAVAKESVRRYAEQTPDALTRLGFEVYGHRGSNSEADKADSCKGIDILAPLGGFNAEGAREVLARFEPKGWTPVAGSLRKATEAFEGREEELNRVVLVTDGAETCDGDPVAAARRLKESGVEVTVDVVGFDIQAETDVERLRRVAKAGGGEYVDAKTGASLSDYFNRLNEAEGQVLDSVICLEGELVSTKVCQQDVYNKSLALIQEEQSNAGIAGNQERREAIDVIRERVIAVRDRVLDASTPDRNRRLKELRTQLERFREAR